MQHFIDPASPRQQLAFEQLPRTVRFPPQIVAAVARHRMKYPAEVFTEAYARKTLEQQTLAWYYDGLPVAYKPLPDGIEVLGVGWEETAKFLSTADDLGVKVVQA